MEFFEQFGITQRMLEAAVLISIVAVVIAVYWRLIVIGGAGLFILWVFINHQSVAQETTKVTEKEKIQIAAKQRFEKYHTDFMEDCMSIAANDKDQCDSIWKERQEAEQEIEKKE